jgi:hypothetical protein
MEKILDKISSYNIFNFLFPGAIFSIISDHVGLTMAPSDKIIDRIIWYYFTGLVISRIGSVLIEPALKFIKFVQYSNYGEYLIASKADDRMEVMVEVSNTYRTLLAVFFTLLISIPVNYFADKMLVNIHIREIILITSISALFLLSFRKQSNYISQRVSHYGRPN